MISILQRSNGVKLVFKCGKIRPFDQIRHRHGLLTLAIETSCDDTSVALVEKRSCSLVNETWDKKKTEANDAVVHFHKTLTANSLAYKGIHPVIAQEHHQEALPELVREAVSSLPEINLQNAGIESVGCAAELQSSIKVGQTWRRKPDFVTVTRGPGMRSNLFTGLDVAKGLAVAWNIPFVGVNHMQAHTLTPRLVSALSSASGTDASPAFPFLSLLVSGGHTMLIHSKSLCDHPTLASTSDIAVGDALDKIARSVLPPEVLESSKSTSYGALLETFAFPDANYDYVPPRNRKEELYPDPTRWGWKLGVPLASSRAGAKAKSMEFSYSGLCTSAADVVRKAAAVNGMSKEEQQDLAKAAMRVAFEHLASRVVWALQGLPCATTSATDRNGNEAQSVQNNASSVSSGGVSPCDTTASTSTADATTQIKTLVVSGGVAANKFLRHLLRVYLDQHGYSHLALVFPPLHLCTDNAAMIGWAGLEMFEAGWTSDLKCRALRKWSLDPSNPADGGILGVEGWQRHGIPTSSMS